MGKYDGLGAFLRKWSGRNTAEGVELSFLQIEGIVRGVLPNAASDSCWWSDSWDGQGRGPQQRAWIDAGFEAVADTKRETVYFKRVTADCEM